MLNRLPSCCALVLVASACELVPCGSNAQCPPRSYCEVPVGADRGTCTSDCTVSAQCGAGQVCSSRGQCVAESADLEVFIDEPAAGRTLAAGQPVDVAGRVMVARSVVTLTLGGLDGVQCLPVNPQVLDMVPTGRTEQVSFRFSGVVPGEGGGHFSVTAAADGVKREARVSYASAPGCSECPSVRLTVPAEGFSTLAPYALSTRVRGTVGQGGTAALFAQLGDGVLRIPLGAGELSFDRVLPAAPGVTRVGVETRAPSGAVRTCQRLVEAAAPSTPLSAHLGFEGASADMDLVVVPPGATLSSGSCSANGATEGCTVPTGNARSPGPEAVLVSEMRDGAWGVAVLAIPGGDGAQRAVVQLLRDGEPELLAGPRTVDTSPAQTWVVARITVAGGERVVELLDRVAPDVPAGPPESW